MNRELKKAKNLSDKHLMLFLLMNEWVKVKQDNKSISSFLLENGYKRIAIYGMSYAGQRLFDELWNSEIEIVNCVDQKCGGNYRNHPIVSVNELSKEVDTVIVTPIFYFDEIRFDMEKQTNASIISLEEIIYGLGEND